MSAHITAFEVENVKRVKAVALDCTGSELTVIGGDNGQGKTSVLDALMWALGGDRFKPTNPVHTGADEAYIKVTLDNGITVERKGVGASLKVTSATGKGGQALLNEFINPFALNLPKFLQATGIEKAKMLLDAFPELGKQLQRLNEEYKKAYDDRLSIGRIADQKAKYAEELPFDMTAPDMPLSGAEMAGRLQAALSLNARNDSLRRDAGRAKETVDACEARQRMTVKRVAELEAALADARSEAAKAFADVERARTSMTAAQATAAQLQDQDTSSISKELEQIDSLNARVRANESKKNAEAEAEQLKHQYAEKTAKIEEIRANRLKLLASVNMPLPDLSIDEAGELIYHGQKWDCMSGSEQLQVGTAICAAMNPKCGFVLLDQLETLDLKTLRTFSEWLASRGLQAIGTRVSTGDECSIIIEDGMVKGEGLEL